MKAPRSISNLAALAALVTGVLCTPACGGPPPARSPDAAASFSHYELAAGAELGGDFKGAVEKTFDTLRMSTGDNGLAPAVMASLDDLVYRRVAGFDGPSALAFRVPYSGAQNPARPGLAKIHDDSHAGLPRALLARALETLSIFDGDEAEAAKWRARSGCVQEATVFAPDTWQRFKSVDEAPKVPASGKLPSGIPSMLGVNVPPVITRGLGCELSVTAASATSGTRDVVFDVTATEPARAFVGLWAAAPAVLHAGSGPSTAIFARAHAEGPGRMLHLAHIELAKGTTRFRLRAATSDNERVEVFLTPETTQGEVPWKVHAPKPGEAADDLKVKILERDALLGVMLKQRTPSQATTYVAAAIAAGRRNLAAQWLPHVQGALRDLLEARVIEMTPDLAPSDRAERTRSAYERVLASRPNAWEAMIGSAQTEARRRGQKEAQLAALAQLDRTKDKVLHEGGSILGLYDALLSSRENLLDREAAAYRRVSDPMKKSALYRSIKNATDEGTGKERTNQFCMLAPGQNRGSDACYTELLKVGERDRARRELDRLRALQGKQNDWLMWSLRHELVERNEAAARAIFDRMAPGERTLSARFLTSKAEDGPARTFLERMLTTADDSVGHLPGPLRLSGDDPLKEFEGLGEKMRDERGSAMPSAPTAILKHLERYDLSELGVLRVTLYDVRRVGGTTDVELNAQASVVRVDGDDTFRVLRRRILKRDGRIIEPNPTPNASQSHADLSQLEAGDLVEAIYESFSAPDDTWNIGFDGPDLMPERTAVVEADISLRYPKAVALNLRSHPMLGAAQEKVEGAFVSKTFHVKDQAVRRIEFGTPRRDRAVSVTATTRTWQDVGRALSERASSLEDGAREVTEWAKAACSKVEPAAADDKRSEERRKAAAALEAVGKVVHRAMPDWLADYANREGGESARLMLGTHEGSRTWLLHRALGTCGIKSDIWVAENEPYSGQANFPPRLGRYTHPLLLVSFADGEAWVDADLQGPPLPIGRISPELRGRSALSLTGASRVLPSSGEEVANVRDEVDIRLKVEPTGDATGRITLLLRGAAAQALAEDFIRVVGFEREKALRTVVLGWLPAATVDEVALSSREGSGELAIRAEVHVQGYASRDERRGTLVVPGLDAIHVVYPRPYSGNLSSVLLSQGARESDLSITRTYQYHVHRTLELPRPSVIQRLPGAFATKAGPLSSKREVAVSGNIVTEDFTLDLGTGNVVREDLGKFTAEVRRTDEGFLASTRLGGLAPLAKPIPQAPARPPARPRPKP